MIHRLRRQKKLNNKSFRVLLTYTIENLDLGYVYLTEGTIKLVGQRCPNLKVLNMRECGYVLTDHMMEILLKVRREKIKCRLIFPFIVITVYTQKIRHVNSRLHLEFEANYVRFV